MSGSGPLTTTENNKCINMDCMFWLHSGPTLTLYLVKTVKFITKYTRKEKPKGTKGIVNTAYLAVFVLFKV